MGSRLGFTVLGPVAASRDGVPVPLGPPRQMALLAVLLSRPNRPMSAAELTSAVWDDEPPASGRGIIASYVYRLRQAFGPANDVLEHSRDGYSVRVEPDAVDSSRFERVVRAGLRDRHAGRSESALPTLREGLAMWRGEPFANLPGQLLAAERLRLNELRRGALASAAELELAADNLTVAFDHLWPAHLGEPSHEGFTCLLMTTLCRMGRQAEALAAYGRTVAVLDAELGVRPGAPLREVHRAVLVDDPRVGSSKRSTRILRHRDVPAPTGTLVGRAAELHQLVARRPEPARCTMITVEGPPGSGKTTLLLHAAQALDPMHRDGQLYVDLHGSTAGRAPLSATAALRVLLNAVGIHGRELPRSLDQRAALWRASTTGRTLLVVLDDAARAAQLAPLLPGAGCTILVTTRTPLELPVTDEVILGPLADNAAEALLRQAAGPAFVGDQAMRRRVIELCRGLPGALIWAGRWLRRNPQHGPAGLLDRLADTHALPGDCPTLRDRSSSGHDRPAGRPRLRLAESIGAQAT